MLKIISLSRTISKCFSWMKKNIEHELMPHEHLPMSIRLSCLSILAQMSDLNSERNLIQDTRLKSLKYLIFDFIEVFSVSNWNQTANFIVDWKLGKQNLRVKVMWRIFNAFFFLL